MPTLIDRSTEQLTPDLLARLGMLTGEKPDSLQKAATSLIPLLLCAISTQAGAAEGLQHLFQSLDEQETAGELGQRLGGAGTRDLVQSGAGLARWLFGGSTSAVVQASSSTAGISGSSAANLLAVLAPLVLVNVIRTVEDEDRAAGLLALLASEADGLRQALPPEFDGLTPCTAPALDILPTPAKLAEPDAAPASSAAMAAAAAAAATSVSAAASLAKPLAAAPTVQPPAAAATRPAATPPDGAHLPKRSAWRWLLPLLLLGTIVALAWYFLRPQPVVAPTAPPAATEAATQAPTEAAIETATEAATETPTETATQAPTEAAAIETATEAATETPTEAATETPTEAATETPTTVTATAATQPSVAFDAPNSALCTAIAAAQTTLDEGPAITAQTSLADLQAHMADIRTATNAVTSAAAQGGGGVAVTAIDGVDAAVDVLDRLVSVLSSDTVGNAAVTVSPALGGVRTAYSNLSTAACTEP